MTKEKNDMFVMPKRNKKQVEVEFHKIPFIVEGDGESIKEYDYMKEHKGAQISIDENLEALFFLGMVTKKPEGSEWWGQSERYYDNSVRVFIGDKLGRINIIYQDETMDTVPLIFGVNVWNYELFEPLKENEKNLNTYSGPYEEPFKSDQKAKKILENSLVLMENDAIKQMKYVFGIKVKSKKVSGVSLYKDGSKNTGFSISAITGLKSGKELDKDWKIYDADYFLRKEYYSSMDKLARRLYQFKDEIPNEITTKKPKGYEGPEVSFEGNKYAKIFTNVYHHNIHDVATCKVDEKGMSHTSSKWAPSFGLYVGFGTYRENVGAYYDHIWIRDVGRELIELSRAGIDKRIIKAADVLHKYLYDGSSKYEKPNWKRISNASELGKDIFDSVSGKENDGHGSAMLFIYNLYATGTVDTKWLIENRKAIFDAAEWIGWQIKNPKESNFDKVLYSESEASTQIYGGYDLYSNVIAYYALKGYQKLGKAMEDKEIEKNSKEYSRLIRKGILDKFISIHPRYGKIFVDTIDDCWTYEYKRFAWLFFMTDIYGYDCKLIDDELYEICENTYLAQKEDYFSFAAGRQMGYGQGYLTETTIVLDQYEDMTKCIEQAAMFCYHHSDYNYIVPEGVIMHPSKRYWFRNSDLGNAVQQGEIIKCARLIIGLDDFSPESGLKVIPRLPEKWDSIKANKYKISNYRNGNIEKINVDMLYERIDKGYKLKIISDNSIYMDTIRFGPFDKRTEGFKVNEAYSYRRIERNDRCFVYVKIESEVNDIEIEVLEK